VRRVLAVNVDPAQEIGQPAKTQEKPTMQTPSGSQVAQRFTPPSPKPSAPMLVSFNGDLLEVSAVLSDAAAVDRLVKALEANKTLLPLTAKKDEAAN
jgi:hypothetical protein